MRKKQIEELGLPMNNNNEKIELLEKEAEGLRNAVRLQSDEHNSVLMSLGEVKTSCMRHEQQIADLQKQVQSVLVFLQKAKAHMVP